MRIHITGNAGSGKSTFSKNLGEILGIDVFGLDKIVWQVGWRATPKADRSILESVLVERPQWIIEGVSSTVRNAADVIIFLDFSRGACYWRCAKRNRRYLFKSRPGLPERCPEIKIISKLARIIWQFPRLARLAIVGDLNRDDKIAITLATNDEIALFLDSLRHNSTQQSDLKTHLVKSQFTG